ncbi:MAG: SOS response-associated peptidase [Betaproteobacteria bacterium]
MPLKTNQKRVFSLPVPEFAFKPSVFPLDTAPIIRRKHGSDELECAPATFGLIPFWSKDRSIGKKTYNARSETVAEKPAYRIAWRQRQYCIAPMAAFYEPNWETGRAVRWRIEVAGEESLGVAAIWDRWMAPDGQEHLSFSLLTLNADDHPVMRRFHAPEDEKRMLLILHPPHFEAWLNATTDEAQRFMQQFPAELMTAVPDPRPRKTKRDDSPQPDLLSGLP